MSAKMYRRMCVVAHGGRRTAWGKLGQVTVAVVDDGECIGITTPKRRTLGRDEKIRFGVAAAKSSRRTKGDWYWYTVRATGAFGGSFDVGSADVAHEHESAVREAVAAGKVPVLISIGKQRGAALIVLDPWTAT